MRNPTPDTDLAAIRRRRDELIERMAAMDPAAVDEMQEFIRSLPTGVLTQLRAEES